MGAGGLHDLFQKDNLLGNSNDSKRGMTKRSAFCIGEGCVAQRVPAGLGPMLSHFLSGDTGALCSPAHLPPPPGPGR